MKILLKRFKETVNQKLFSPSIFVPVSNQPKPMRNLLLMMILCIAGAGNLYAQGVTTSTLSGTVTDENGESLPGTNVVATHEPSGTQYGTSVNPNGRFNIPNMRVGGPYKISISFVGYQSQTIENVYLKLAETFTLNIKLAEEGTQLNELVVSGSQDKLLNSERSGTVTNIGTREISTLPTISRSINDMTRLTPQASSTSQGAIGGGNYRQNYITVDGADFNNTFGIGTNLPAGGSPISLDALEEISVNITPFDVRQSGFIGSSINAVTRSGTNELSGSVYTFWRNQNQQGNKVGDNPAFTRQDLKVNTYGFRLGGPIIENKLFFFVNAEQGTTTSPGQTYYAATDAEPFGSSPNIARPTVTQLNSISQYLKDQYGYDAGAYQGYDFESDNTRLVGRLDWNINTNHRLSARYSQVESKSPSFPSTSRSPLPGYSSTAGRTNNNALWFRNANYYQEANFYSLSVELNSTFGKFANTLRGTFTHQNDPRSSDSRRFPFVDILEEGIPYTSFGYEPFSDGNLRDVKTYSFVDNVTWNSGIHNFTVGGQIDVSATKNGFQRFGTSYYTFNSWDDFVNGEKPVDFAITYSLLPGYEQAYPRFKFAMYSLYGQDEISISEKFKLTAGLRLDLPQYLDVAEVKTHPLVADLVFANGERIDTGVLPENKLLWSPRVGFNWDVLGDRSLQVRGGTGVFTGRVPTVWIVAQSGDAGLLQFTETYQTPTADRDNPAAYATPGPFNPDPGYYRPENQPQAGTSIPSSISTTDRNFSFPQTWKSTLAVDKKLPFDVVGTVELIYNRDLQVALGRNANLVQPQALNVEGYPDNRVIYPAANKDKFINPLTAANSPTPNLPTPNGDPTGTQQFNAMVLDNKAKGHYFSVTTKLEKQFASGFSGMVAYTFSDAQNLYDGSGDQLINTWSITPIVNNANNPPLSYASYVVPHRVVGSISFRKEYLKHLGTSISLFYEGSSGGRFSYMYAAGGSGTTGDLNRDGQTNDLIYVPKDPSEITFVPQTVGSGANAVTYTAEEQSAAFFAYIEQDDYLRTRKGKYAERNGAKLPWRSQWDLRFAQDVFTNIGGKKNTLQFTIDIFNFGNLLNKDWGIVKVVNASGILIPTSASVNALTPGGTATPEFRLATDRGKLVSETFRDNNSILSTYYMQFGLRYTFN